MANEHKSPADALSAILGSGGSTTTTDTPATATATGELDLASDDLQDDGAATSLEVVEDITTDQPQPRQRRQRGAPKAQAHGGRLTRTFGLLCLVGGIAVEVLSGRGQLPEAIAGFGGTSSALFAIGTIAYVLGAMRRQASIAQVRIDAISFAQQEAQLDMQANLRYLVEQQQAHAEKPPAEGEELERVLVAMQRVDEKVNNLSRAMKAYGKPLMEIANQSADVSAQQNQLRGHVEAMLGAMQQGFTRIEATARNQTIDLSPLERQTAETAEDMRRTLAAFSERLPTAQALQQLQQQLVRVEASVQATSQRLDDSEVRKSLLRLEDTSKLQGKQLSELARQEALQAEVQKLERQVDNAIGKVGASVDQLRSKNVSGLETSVRDIQRELASLATSVAYIQQTVKNGGGRATGTAPPTPMVTTPISSPVPAAAPTDGAPHATAPTPSAPASTPTPTAARPAAAAAANATEDALAGVDQNKTGTHASTGKNVLGAIAKLKKMKG